MSNEASVLTLVLVAAIVAQALLPKLRLLIVATGAVVAAVVSELAGVATAQTLLAHVPWDVLVILASLGLLSSLFAEARLFDRLAVLATRLSRGDPRRVTYVFAGLMYVTSGLLNNLTALVLVLPVLLVLVRTGARRPRHLRWTLGLFLVSCNLGGAATPIGDFPAIVLLGGGRLPFGEYLAHALPTTLATLCLLLAVVRLVVRPAGGVPRDAVSTALTRSVIEALHRRIRVDRRRFVPAAVALTGMLAAWSFLPAALGVGPELIAWGGAALALLACGSTGERIVRGRFDAESVLFLLSLFVMVGAVRETGLFLDLARALVDSPLPEPIRLSLFLVAAGLSTGLFSAGPSMAALVEVADVFAETFNPVTVYVGLALSVCAGSSLLLTAATSGPLAQAIVEREKLEDDDGRPVRFGFVDFLPVGLLSFGLIQLAALVYALAMG